MYLLWGMLWGQAEGQAAPPLGAQVDAASPPLGGSTRIVTRSTYRPLPPAWKPSAPRTTSSALLLALAQPILCSYCHPPFATNSMLL